MTVLLVRHAVARARRKWNGPDELRPLTPRGVRQAELLPEVLADFEIETIQSSPSVRCVDTVRPLAKDRGLDIDEVPALAEGKTQAALRAVRGARGSTMLCTHGDVGQFILEALAKDDGADLGEDPRWAKGSAWVLDFDNERCTRATYLPAPA